MRFTEFVKRMLQCGIIGLLVAADTIAYYLYTNKPQNLPHGSSPDKTRRLLRESTSLPRAPVWQKLLARATIFKNTVTFVNLSAAASSKKILFRLGMI